MEKVKIRADIAKFKVLYFAGVVGAGSYMIINYQKFIDFFGKESDFKKVIYVLVFIFFAYGIAGIIKNIRILTFIDEEMKK